MKHEIEVIHLDKIKKKIFSACIDVMGSDAGTLYVCAESLNEAHLIIKENLGSEVTYVGELWENPHPATNWPSETYAILGESDGLLFPVDEDAVEAEQVAANQAWQDEQMEALFKKEASDRLSQITTEIKKGVRVSWSAFDIARIGKDQMYAKVQEAFIEEYCIFLIINEMSAMPQKIEGEDVEYLCIPTDYKIS